MDSSLEAFAVAMNDHRKSMDGRNFARNIRASEPLAPSSSLASSLSTSLFGLSPHPSGSYFPSSLERANSMDVGGGGVTSNASYARGYSLDRTSFTAGDDFESLVQGYALKVPAVSAPVPVPGSSAPSSSRAAASAFGLTAGSLPLRFSAFHQRSSATPSSIAAPSAASAFMPTSPVVGRQQAKAMGDIGMYWKSMYVEDE